MAYNRTYYFDFASDSGITYRVEMYDQIATQVDQNIEGKLGANPVNIKYGSDNSKMFASFKPSTFTLEFMVTDLNSAHYIDQLRVNRNERDVYVALYRESVNGSASPQYGPVWTGYLLLDLSDDPDEATPYPVTLKFIDGLASLKYFDFVPSTTTQAADHLYSIGDTFIPDINNSGGMYDSHRTFIDMISICLGYSGYGSTTTGATEVPVIQTAVRWYNGEHTATNIDPLRYTRGRPNVFYDEEDTPNSSTKVKYKAKTCYDVLKAICKAWGMRVYYWKGRWQFVQINEFRETESGSVLAPDNISGFKYSMAGSPSTSLPSIGNYWGVYSLTVQNTYQGQSSPVKNFKLAGGTYGILPAYKQVIVDFMNLDDTNHFKGFPLLMGYNPSDPLPDPPWPQNKDSWTWKSLGNFTFDGATHQDFFQRIVLAFNNWGGVNGEMELFWGLFARPAGTGSNVANASPEDNGWVYQCYTTNSPAPGAAQTEWKGTTNWYSGGTQFGNGQTSGPYANEQWYYSIWSSVNVPATGSNQNILDPLNATNNAGNTVSQMQNISCPPGVFTIGEWEFAYYTRCNSLEGGGGNTDTNVYQHGCCIGNFNYSHWINNKCDYQNVPVNQGINSSVFSPVVNGAIGNFSSTTTTTTTTTDTEVLKVKDVYYGDAGYLQSQGGLQVYNGSIWVKTSLGGDWGIDTLGGENSFSIQLTDDVLSSQGQTIKTFSVQTTLDPTRSLYYNDGTANKPQFAFPGTKFITPAHAQSGTPEESWIMHTGTWSPSLDTWKWTLYEQENFTLSKSSIVIGNPGQNTGIHGVGTIEPVSTDGKIISGSPVEFPVQSKDLHKKYRPIAIVTTEQAMDFTDITTGITVTSIAVRPLPTALTESPTLRIGDIFCLYAQAPVFKVPGSTQDGDLTHPEFMAKQWSDNAPIMFEVAANASEGDTAIIVTSKQIYRSISIGDTISFDEQDLWEQYQHKTRGTVGGVPVYGNALGPIRYSGGEYLITGVDTVSLKILPRDFIINDDGGSEALEFKDASVNTGLQVGDSAQEMIATVNIPYNTKATEVYVFGNVTTKVVEVYEAGVNANGIGSTIGTGTTNGAAIALTPTASDDFNYLLILVKVTSTSQRIYGGRVVLTTIV